MKYKNLFLLAGIFIFNYINAQPGSSNWRDALFMAPYVTGGHPASDLLSNQTFRFDTKVIVRSSMEDNTTVDICMWLNTREGYMGILPAGRNGSGPVEEINPESPDFIFIVLGINGTAYRYYNSIGKNNILEKWVSTANTDLFVYEFPGSIGADFERAADAVLALAGRARSMIDDDLRDLAARPRRVDGDEAMHLAIEVHVLDDALAIRLERAAVVVDVDAADARDEPVRNDRGESAREQLVLAVFAPAADDVEALVHLGEQARDVGRIVLQIGIERNDHFA